MKIYLYLEDRIVKYNLPEVIQGSFIFDPDNSEYKLINIDARDGKWVLYSTTFAKVMKNGNLVPETELEENTFYSISRDNKTYMVYIESSYNKDFNIYSFAELDLHISSSNKGNITYTLGGTKDFSVEIKRSNEVITLKTNVPHLVYVNKKALSNKESIIKYGDDIRIYGLKLIILKGLVLINDGLNGININLPKAKLQPSNLSYSVDKMDPTIKEEDLYKKDDYFLKAPRFRRMIKTKEVKFATPPQLQENQELPFILTVGPMVTMGAVSAINAFNLLAKLATGESTLKDSLGSLIMCMAMLASMILWPMLTRMYNKHMMHKNKSYALHKYNRYLDSKRKELQEERTNQDAILKENLLSIGECSSIIEHKNNGFWDKRVDQNDFLTLRLGIGDYPLNAVFNYSKEEFILHEDKLKQEIEKIINDYKNLIGVPVGYSFYNNYVTAILGNTDKTLNLLNNLILQLIAYYSYEDIKICMFTDEKDEEIFDYLKYLNHTFSSEKDFRFFSSNPESAKDLANYLNQMVDINMSYGQLEEPIKPYYIIIVDGYDKVKRFEFVKKISECKCNIGFSLIIRESRFGNLPSKCYNIINIDNDKASILKNTYEDQVTINFKDEIVPNLDMSKYAKIVSNVPVELDETSASIPNSINFLEMEKVGKVEQLNILNRWNTNDATLSLRSEIGIGENGELMYLDLHEKAHGPHGLIAGMTGSGKSEFIITYILSMAINYSPEYVSFILIDYKGGGLAGAFENTATGISLPHLAGTITNLDKAEMDRTLVSINSEIQRRQMIFNEVRDALLESTIDIYKYQKFYQEGKIEYPVPHLFIICDEFAELKSQQPEFMDNLISVARVGRSLGVHLILATQKPSGVVNEQIWSNTKFRVCLKVQDAQDSKEMLKKPDAASLKQTGRFYLQVGYDEYFALGQSAWCGAKYFPSNEIVKESDNSINFINESGLFIKNIKESSKRGAAEGEQLSAILKNIIEVSEMTNIKAERLWLENIKPIILVDDLIIKYNIETSDIPNAIVGEYDAPEKQDQGLILYDYIKDGNTIIYGNDGSENEMLLHSIIYSTCKRFDSSKINYYMVDYGSESLKVYDRLPHFGGIVFSGEEEKYNNLFKMLTEETKRRKKILSLSSGDYKDYIKEHNDMPIIAVILNNYDSIYESNNSLYDLLPTIVRDSERYGIIYIITATAINSVANKIVQNFNNIYTLKLKDSSDYSSVLNVRNKIIPREIFGRGLVKDDTVHEYQTASIIEDYSKLNGYIIEFANTLSNMTKAKNIPILPDSISIDTVKPYINNLTNIPIGISKKELKFETINLLDNIGNIITSSKITNTKDFTLSIIDIVRQIPNTNTIIIDSLGDLNLDKSIYKNYYNSNYEKVLETVTNFVSKLKTSNSQSEGVIFIYSLSKLIIKLKKSTLLENLIKELKEYEKISLVIIDDSVKIKKYAFEQWFSSTFNINDGIYIGKGLTDQNLIHLSQINKELTKDIKNDMGYLISEGTPTLCKLVTLDNGGNNEK